jgi:hypothetical protein
MSPRVSRVPRRTHLAGFTAIEMLVTAVVLGLTLSGVLAMAGSVSVSSDRHGVDARLGDGARRGMDEMLQHLRGGGLILNGQSVGGRTFSSTASEVVFRAPALNPADPTVEANKPFAAGAYDYVGFYLDPAVKGGTLYESVQANAVSSRTTRTKLALATGVSAMKLTYRVRERFGVASAAIPLPPATGAVVCTLIAAPTAAPTAYVNGVVKPCTVVGSLATVSASRGDDVQFIYPVDPTVSANRPLISEVDVALTMTGKDSRLKTRTLTLQGGARLRNVRD